MNEEQKAIAEDISYMFDQGHITHVEALTAMEALLQELIDAPEPEPVGYTNETELDYVRKYEALPVSGTFWPTSDEDACVALYTAPPANNQSEQHLEMVNAPALSAERIFKLFLEKAVDKGTAGIYDFARAIEREILGVVAND